LTLQPRPAGGTTAPSVQRGCLQGAGGRCGALHSGSCSPAGRWSGAAPPSHCRPASAPRPAPRSSPRRRRLSLGRRKPRRERGSRGGRSGAMGDSKVKVAVRVRPMNRRELDLHTKCVVDVDANKVILHPVNTNLSKGDARNTCFCSADKYLS
uniref:Kinesin family member 13B n=1 Tax=Phasianus colchicus TaxID=9054 RepID=A0A669Q0Y4_PHACC